MGRKPSNAPKKSKNPWHWSSWDTEHQANILARCGADLASALARAANSSIGATIPTYPKQENEHHG